MEIARRRGVQDVLRAGLVGERASGRSVIRVYVRVDDVPDSGVRPGRDVEIDARRIDGVDDDGELFPAAADEIRRGNDGLCVETLADDHDCLCLTLGADSDREPGVPPRRQALLGTPRPESVLAKQCDRLERKDAVRSA